MSVAEGGSSRVTSEAVVLKTGYDDVFDKGKCIICQTKTTESLSSTAAGQKRVREAAEIREDEVLKRLKVMDAEDKVFYHVNNKCYKSYTMAKSLQNILEKKPERALEETESPRPSTSSAGEEKHTRRSKSIPRPPPSNQGNPDNQKCVICGFVRTKVKCLDERTKYRISESKRANTILAAASMFQDEVFDRIADLDSEERVFAADLYAHANCIRAYIRKYEYAMESKEHTDKQPSQKWANFQKANEVLEPLLNSGYGFTLTDIRELMVEFEESLLIHNNEVKIFLVRTYGDRIRFCPSERKNEALLVFSADLTPEQLAAKIRSQDVLKRAGTILREAFTKVDFGIDDKFCDGSELLKAWESTNMPDVVLTLFSTLFNVSKSKLLQAQAPELHSEEHSVDDEEDNHMDRQTIQMFCLFQMMYYQLHHGRKKKPLHTMAGHAIYDKCKSRELITSFNRIGISTSYNEVVRSRSMLAAYAVQSSQINNTPLPSHFTRKGFTIGALDNFDFEDSSSLSGTYGTHDTAMVLFQDCVDGAADGKPTVSSVNINKRGCKLTQQLPCQLVLNHNKPENRPGLPENFKVAEDIGVKLSDDVVKEAAANEFLITLTRCGLPNEEGCLVPTWAGIHALISQSAIPLKRVGFLPVIPSPVTNYATVYTALKNFQNVRVQLEDQPTLPVFCDEGVFRIVFDIVLCCPEEFDDIYPMLGMFHMAKVALRCAGSFISRSGMEDALVENEIFGCKTVQAVLHGTHYVRSFTGILIISEAIESLQWKGFWINKDKSSFEDELAELRKLQKTLQSRDATQSHELFCALTEKAKKLKQDFENFVKECSERSELCRYWGIFLQMTALVKDLVCADREGNWKLHVKTVESLVAVFRSFNCINYLRYGSWYLERVKKLEVDNPFLYRKFIEGHFVVKDKKGNFNAVAPDMKLEQTIQRSQKSSKGIVGQTRKCEYVAQWQLVYHEVLNICNVFRDLTNSKLMDHRETVSHHDLMGKRGEKFNENVSRLLNALKQQGNPYELTKAVPLHNFVTKQYVEDDVKESLFNVMKNGTELYEQLKAERYRLKEKKLSDTISKVKLQSFDYQSQTNHRRTTNKISSTKKQLAQAHREMEIGKERGELVQDILSHDLLPTNTLFDGDAPSKPAKHILVREITKNLAPEEFNFDKQSTLKSTVVVDFMSQIRAMNMSSMETFGDVVNTLLQRSKSVCTLQEELHIIFDSYLERSLKESERIRRMSTTASIELANITCSTPLPVQLDKFWSSSSNKINLEEFARQRIAEEPLCSGFRMIASGMVINDNLVPAELYSRDETRALQELKSNLEEADLRLVSHVNWAVENGAQRIIVLSNDTDVVIVLLRYVPTFINQGLSELWVRYGTGEKRRYIPLHVLFKKLGPLLCSVLIKAHILTGNDELSKIGTKLGALNADPINFLKVFAEMHDQWNSDEVDEVEKYLVRVWKPSSKYDRFNQLRFSEYKRSVPICDLPPTSDSIRGHILRSFYIIRRCINLLDNSYQEPDPCNFGWEDVDGVLRPSKSLNPLPAELLCVCTCKLPCDTNKCSCRRRVLKCTTFCKDNQENCKNKI